MSAFNPFRRNVLTALVSAAALAVTACSSTPDPTVVAATIQAEENLNPDATGRPSPLVIRVYELKSLSAFKDADFFSLWDSDQQTLGADLTSREEMVLRPGDTNSVQRITKPETRFIGVVAAYRDLERAVWRASMPVTPEKTTAMTVKLDDRSVTIAGSVQ